MAVGDYSDGVKRGAFTYSLNDGYTDYGDLGTGALAINAFAINNSGTIAGTVQEDYRYLNQSFILDVSGLHLLDPIPTSQSYTLAYGINDSGQAVGGNYAGYSFTGAAMYDSSYQYSTIAGMDVATDINNSGVVIGTVPGYMGDAAFYKDGVVTKVFDSGSAWSRINDINSSGDMVGYSSPGDGTQWSYYREADGTIYSLDEILNIDQMGWDYINVTQMNDRGDIAGNYGTYQGDGARGVFVAYAINSTVPEPTSIALMGLALVGLGATRRKQKLVS